MAITSQAALTLKNVNLQPLSFCEQVSDFGDGLLKDIQFKTTSISTDRFEVIYSGLTGEGGTVRCGEILHCISGANKGQSRIILYMTGTADLQVIGGFTNVTALGDEFVIYKHGDPIVIATGGSTSTVVANASTSKLGIRDEVATVDTNPAAFGAADDQFWVGYDLICIRDDTFGNGAGGIVGEARQVVGFDTSLYTFTVSPVFSGTASANDVFMLRRRIFGKNFSLSLSQTVIEREAMKNDFDAIGRTVGGKGGTCSFDLELTGLQQIQTAETTVVTHTPANLAAAANPVSPAWGRLMKACGFEERYHASFTIGTTNTIAQISLNSFSGDATTKFDEGCGVMSNTGEMRFVESITNATNDKLVVYTSPNGAEFEVAPTAAAISPPTITYRPVDADNTGCVLQVTYDNITYQMYGCKGNFEFSIEKDMVVTGKFNFQIDHWLCYSERFDGETNRSYEYNYQNTNPPVGNNVEAIMDDVFIPVKGFSFNHNTQNSAVDAIGGLNGRFGFTAVGRKPGGKIATYPVSLTDQKEYRDLMAQNALDVTIVAGGKIGETVAFRARKMRLVSQPAIQDSNGLMVFDSDYSCDNAGSVSSGSAGGETKFPSVVIAVG